MSALRRFADRRPLLFVLTALAAWLLVGTIIAIASSLLLKAPISDALPQTLATLAATGLLLLVAARLGWLRSMGITRLGGWTVWGVTLLLAIYVTLANSYAFFGDLEYSLSYVAGSDTARGLLFRQAVVGFVEETVFRGFALYALVRVWGSSRKGMLAAVLVQAALFGLLHALQVIAGGAFTTVLVNILETFAFGIWLGVLVLWAESVWPAVFLHALANYVVLVKGAYAVWIQPEWLQYFRATLFDLPLVLLALWVIWKVNPLPQTDSQIIPQTETASSTE